MSRKFQCKAVPSKWLEENGRRLDCGPYMSGLLEIRELLKKHKTQLLPELTAGHDGGIDLVFIIQTFNWNKIYGHLSIAA